MQTVIHNKKEGSIKFISQQYEIGSYVAVYHEGKSMPDQMTFGNVTEEQFHKDMRSSLKKGWKIILEESTEIK